MITQSKAVDWAVRQITKSLDWGGYTQCVAFVRWYFRANGIDQFPPLTKGAKQIWDVDLNPAQVQRIRPGNPQPGDIAVYGATKNNPAGHMSVVVALSKGGYVDVSQNIVNPVLAPDAKHGSPIASKEWVWPNDRVIGFIRPKFAPEPSKPQLPKAAAPAPAVAPKPVVKGVNVNTERSPHRLSTLWGISRQFLGDGRRWPEIYDHPNNAAVKAKRPDPNVIQPGDVWFVPQ
jgi:hypothetical protein